MKPDNDLGVSNTESFVHRHSGVLQIVQTVIGGCLLLIVANFYSISKTNSDAQVEQAKTTAGVQSQLRSLSDQLAALQSQMQSVTTLAIGQAKGEIKTQELERRVYDLEQARKLK